MAVNLFRPRGWDCTPSSRQVAGCAYATMRASLGAALVLAGSTIVATIAGQWIHRTDPRLLRAACASKTSADVGRRLLSMTSIPRGAAIIREIQATTEAELAAWADSGAVCP